MDSQHTTRRDIPVIEISPGWAAKDVKTLEQCDEAFAYLMSAVAAIEAQLDEEKLLPKDQQDQQWKIDAACALKYKKAALQIVGHRRGAISKEETRSHQNSRDRILLEYIRRNTRDDEFKLWVKGAFAGSSEHEG